MQVKVTALSKYRLEVDLTSEEAHRLLALLEPVQDEEEGLDRIYWELSRTLGMTPEGGPFRACDSSDTPIDSIFLKEQA